MTEIKEGDIVYRWGYRLLEAFKVRSVREGEVQHEFGGWFMRKDVFTKDEALIEIKYAEEYHKKLLA